MKTSAVHMPARSDELIAFTQFGKEVFSQESFEGKPLVEQAWRSSRIGELSDPRAPSGVQQPDPEVWHSCRVQFQMTNIIQPR
ncbi:hypothetical protein SKAU_G00163890 [Synaphobranchus kaupii]|uniref:Uncharacterized protein n=1 Tax=Synaphobranchus kaupii TaxID=118154 RepID=A0A9Q1IXX8_SYNKA|nr:hypothetical protein SKAU_G00163890 [Synaphobranchus kaupii]